MNIKPFGNNILIEPQQSKQLLGQSLCEYGKVIAIGDSVSKIKVGDVIAYLVWGLNSIEVDGQKKYFVPEDDSFILGTFEV